MDKKHEAATAEAAEIEALVEAYRGMAPAARKVLLGVAKDYLVKFPGVRPVALRLIRGGNADK